MKVEDGKIVKLAVTNHKFTGEIWGTFEQEGMFPDDFPYEPMQNQLRGMSPEENGTVAHDYLDSLSYSPALVFKLPRSNFKGVEELRKGMVFTTKFQSKIFSGHIVEFDESYVTLDCNHPCIDDPTMHTVFIIIDVRDPTEIEREKGFKASLIAL